MNISSFKILPVLVLLSGCAQSRLDSFEPYTPEKVSQGNYETDLKVCRKYAQDYLAANKSLDVSQVAQEGLTGALKQAPAAALDPVVPALGAAGNASSEAVQELGLDASAGFKIIAWCMHDKGLRDGFSTWDPNL